MNLTKIAFCQSGGPLRRIQEWAVVTGHPRMAARRVAPSARQSSHVMAKSYHRKKKNAMRKIILATGYAMRKAIAAMKTNSQQKASAAYLEAYARAMKALKDVENMIHDNPAPEGEVEIHWGHVGDMLRIASELEDILPED
jgi:hypothetical protein